MNSAIFNWHTDPDHYSVLQFAFISRVEQTKKKTCRDISKLPKFEVTARKLPFGIMKLK